MAYSKRYPGGFFDRPTVTTPVDSTFLNAVEAALLKLFDADPSADGQVPQWIAASSKYGPALLLNKNIDPAAAIAKSKLAALNIVDADVASGAAIAQSKLSLSLVQPTHFAGGSKITTSLFSGGPPGSPAHGDIWIATAVDTGNEATTVGVRFFFQYNASSGSAYKWEWIGGGEIAKIGNANAVLNTMTQVAATNFWADAALQSYTVLRAGDWSIRGMFNISSNGGVQSPITAGVFGGGATIGAGGMGAIRMNAPLATAVSTDSTITIEETVFAQGANAVIGIAGNSGVVGTHKMLYTSMRIRPVRIS